MEELKEIWKELPDAKGYFISNYGRCKIEKSKKHLIGCFKDKDGFCKDRDGYYRYTYKDNDGKCKFIAVHRLVALMFIPKQEGKNVVNHIDGNRTNNVVTNLEWVTPRENVYHSFLYGKRRKCLKVPRVAKLTPYQISQIPFLREHYTLKKVAELYNIPYTSIKNIVIKLKRLSQDNQQPSIYSEDYHLNEGSTTIPRGSTLQVNGSGNALPTISGEDIV